MECAARSRETPGWQQVATSQSPGWEVRGAGGLGLSGLPASPRWVLSAPATGKSRATRNTDT